MDDLVSDIGAIADPVARARAASQRIEELRQVIDRLSELRQVGMLEMFDAGMSHAQMARELGLTRARVTQLLAAGIPAARAFLGSGRMTVAVGGKLESGRTDGQSEPVLSDNARKALTAIEGMARAVGLETDAQTVPPPGYVDLNQANLVVLTSPRLLPVVQLALDADPVYGFDHDQDGWFLVDKAAGKRHRSPQDSGEPSDYAYLGRLPRPDGRGTFLYLAGVHSPGTLGAAQYLSEHLSELHKAWKLRRWSMLLRVAYDRATRTVQHVEPLRPARPHEGGGP